MKRFFVFATIAILLALTATPAFAQGATATGDTACFGGTTVVPANATPKNVVLFGCGARITADARVTGDIISFGGEVVIEKGARVGRDIVVFGAPLTIAGEVGRDVADFGGVVTLDSSAVVGRNLAAIGGIVDQKEGAVVKGQVTRGDRTFGTTFRSNRFSFPMPFFFNFGSGDFVSLALLGFVRSVLGALALAALGALTIVFLPNQTKRVGEVAQSSPLPSLGAGCVTFLAAPTLIVLLVVLICTIPIAVVLAFALAIAGVFGWIAIGHVVGEKILQAAKAKEILPVVAVIIGVFLLALVSAVPIVGWLVWLFVAMLGIGAVVLTRFGTRSYPMPVVPSTLPTAAPPASQAG